MAMTTMSVPAIKTSRPHEVRAGDTASEAKPHPILKAEPR